MSNSSPPQQQRQMTTLEFAVIQCRNELVRLAKLIEANPPSSSSENNAASASTKKSSSFFESISNFVHEHNLSFGSDDDDDDVGKKKPTSTSSSKESDESKRKKRELEKEYLSLAKSCQHAAKVSQLEADELRNSIKRLKALKEAAENERDLLEDKLDDQRRLVDALKEANLKAVLASSKSNSPSGTATPISQSQAGSGMKLVSIETCEVGVGVNFYEDDIDPLDSDIHCKNCTTLRTKLASEEERAERREKYLNSENEARERQIAELNQSWKEKLQKVIELEKRRSEAEIRRSAASFLQKSCTAEANFSKKLLQAQMDKLESRNQLSKTLKEMEEVKLDHQHSVKTYEEQLSKLEEENKELRRVLHKISVHNDQSEYENARTESTDQWTSADDQVVGKDDAKGAFHAWLHASSSSNATTSSSTSSVSANHPSSSGKASSGIIEMARRLLAAKLVSSDSGQVSIEDETIARALHHTNETLRDALEENMKLQMKCKELEESNNSIKLQMRIKELETAVKTKK